MTFKEGNMICFKYCFGMSRVEFAYSAVVVTKGLLNNKSFDENKYILLEDSDKQWPKNYLNRGNRTLPVSVKKYIGALSGNSISTAVIDFKGLKVKSEGYLKDNMFYFEAFGRTYKTKVYLTKNGQWRSIVL